MAIPYPTDHWGSQARGRPGGSVVADQRTSDLGGTLVGATGILIGCGAIYHTTEMAGPISFAFPRAVAMVLVVLSMALVLRNVLVTDPTRGCAGGAIDALGPRRVGLLLVLLVAAIAMHWVGPWVSVPASLVGAWAVARRRPDCPSPRPARTTREPPACDPAVP